MARVYVSVGSNIDREYYIRAGLAALHEHYGKLQCSQVYESKAVGFDGAEFFNCRVEKSPAKPSCWDRWRKSPAISAIRSPATSAGALCRRTPPTVRHK